MTNTLTRLEVRHDTHHTGRWAKDARGKPLLGWILITQCLNKPDVHASQSPEIRNRLGSHRSMN